MGKTKIEWTSDSWNPIRARKKATGTIGWHCERVSAGCANCYASTMNVRLGTGLEFKPGNLDSIELFLDEKMLLAPLRWREPRMIFVCSMSDLFAEFVTDEWIDRVFAIMALCPQHIFQCLTKRPTRMRAWFERSRNRTAPIECIAELYVEQPEIAARWPFDIERASGVGTRGWPLPNVWLGISCEDQETADARMPDLLATPTIVRFLSCEPMLGPIEVAEAMFTDASLDVLFGLQSKETLVKHGTIHWIICGGESGHGARPMDIAWARSLRDQCKSAGMPFFMKQMTKKAPIPDDIFIREFPTPGAPWESRK